MQIQEDKKAGWIEREKKMVQMGCMPCIPGFKTQFYYSRT